MNFSKLTVCLTLIGAASRLALLTGAPASTNVPEMKRILVDWIKRYNTLPIGQNPCSSEAFRRPLKQARDWSEYYGRPVHVGEFGCYIAADPESRARFYKAFREALDEFHLGWAVWDWKAGFRYWEEKANQPGPGMREALFPKQD